jgi:hypothetical protein
VEQDLKDQREVLERLVELALEEANKPLLDAFSATDLLEGEASMEQLDG